MLPDKQMFGEGPCHLLSAGSGSVPPCLLGTQHHTLIQLERVSRVALMVTPQPSDDLIDQAWESISTIRAIMKHQSTPMSVTMQTVFVRSAADVPPIRRLFEAYYGDRLPTTSFIVQPPCGGQALAIEAWALGGDDVQVEYPVPDVVTVSYEGLRWVHIAGIAAPANARGAYDETALALAELADRLQRVGVTFKDVSRVWLYQAGITETELTASGERIERYRELNRARTDFFDAQVAAGRMVTSRGGQACYPASTGIGMSGSGLVVGCLALQTERDDVRLQPLENPGQTSAFAYAQRFSAKSPKFSRAMAVAIGDYVTTWISGTASILNSESVHVGDAAKQTEQTLDNIQRLISADNFARHGLPGAGAELSDLAKVRVYVKRPQDYLACRAVCERRLGHVPTIYAIADVCRSELLVEIEGVTFSRVSSP
jgi:enamine deaminase RidA (YjgF/YER057c/UK114 family)